MTKWDLSGNDEQLNREVVHLEAEDVQLSVLEFVDVCSCALSTPVLWPTFC